MLFEQLWFMGLEPEELWRGEARHGGHPGKLPDIGKFPVEGNGFRPGASVIPKNGWTKNLAHRIQNHGPVHLSGKPDRRKAQPLLAVPGTQDLQAFCKASHQSCGSCSDQPGCGRVISSETSASPTTRCLWSVIMHFSAVVPRSTPR